MRYEVTGRVHPERAGVSFSPVSWSGTDGRRIEASCDASQLFVSIELPGVSDPATAKLAAEDFAQIVVSALGFSLASAYFVEAIQVWNPPRVPVVFGVRIEELRLPEAPSLLTDLVTLATGDIFFRLALRDYVRAIGDAQDCASYCYRAVEAIKSAFAAPGVADVWAKMHATLGSSREDIESKVKRFADPVRHGNWIEAPQTDGAQRLEMLKLTRDLLLAYLTYRRQPINTLERACDV